MQAVVLMHYASKTPARELYEHQNTAPPYQNACDRRLQESDLVTTSNLTLTSLIMDLM